MNWYFAHTLHVSQGRSVSVDRQGRTDTDRVTVVYDRRRTQWKNMQTSRKATHRTAELVIPSYDLLVHTHTSIPFRFAIEKLTQKETRSRTNVGVWCVNLGSLRAEGP